MQECAATYNAARKKNICLRGSSNDNWKIMVLASKYKALKFLKYITPRLINLFWA